MRDAFTQNFVQGKEIGAAVAAWVDGELVINLWAGTADEAGTKPWQVNTLSTVLSGTKGLTSTCVHQLVERGELDLQRAGGHAIGPNSHRPAKRTSPSAW